MRTQSLFFPVLVLIWSICVFDTSLSATPSSVTQCNDEIGKVGQCLSFATGKSDKPTKDCCETVKDIKENNPVCLCLVVQQTHKGEAALKQMGVQEAKLLELPIACNLANASASNCPKLLGLSPGSPDAAIFENTTTTAPSVGSSTTTPASPTKDDTSTGFIHGPYVAFPGVMIVVTSVFHLVFSTGLISTFLLGA